MNEDRELFQEVTRNPWSLVSKEEEALKFFESMKTIMSCACMCMHINKDIHAHLCTRMVCSCMCACRR